METFTRKWAPVIDKTREFAEAFQKFVSYNKRLRIAVDEQTNCLSVTNKKKED